MQKHNKTLGWIFYCLIAYDLASTMGWYYRIGGDQNRLADFFFSFWGFIGGAFFILSALAIVAYFLGNWKSKISTFILLIGISAQSIIAVKQLVWFVDLYGSRYPR